MNTLFVTFSILLAAIPNLTIRPFPLGTPPSYTASAIASDPANPERIWFTDQAFQQIGWIDVVTGEVKTFSIRPANGDGVLPAGSPQGLVFGADGNLWFPAILNSGPSVIGKFDRATNTVAYFAIPNAGACTFACRIALGPDGNVWFTETVDQKLGRVTPQGAITEIPIVHDGGASTQIMKGIALGSDGNFWITHGLRAISRVTPSGAATLFRTPATGTPFGITRGADGNVYFTESQVAPDGNKIGRITPAGVITEWAIPTPNANANAIAAGADGKIYFVGQGSKRLGQLDPATGEIRESDIPNGRIPIGVAALVRPATATPASDAKLTTRIAFNTLDPSLADPDVEVAEIEEEEEIAVNPCPNFIQPGFFGAGWEEESYSQELFVTSGRCPCTWKATDLPPGLELGHTGGLVAKISGVPDRQGRYDFTVEWADSSNCSLKKDFTMNVLPFRFVDAIVAKSLSFNAPSVIEVGTEVDFLINVYSTTGKSGFRFDVVDVLPGSLAFVSFDGSCAVAGQMVVCSGSKAGIVTIRVRVLEPGPITNCAQVYVDGDVNPDNNRGCFTLNAEPRRRAVRK